jgi:octaprenyl-diphosphate synthase
MENERNEMSSLVVETAPASPTSLLGLIEEELHQVEERLILETRSDIGAVRDISGHTLLSGGKRLRPALGILCAHAAATGRPNYVYPKDRIIAAGAAAEMIHMATLMHDDVVDEATERRGRPTASAVYGNSITILTGDYLLAKSISLLAHNDENLHVVRVFSDVTVAMAEGEVLQAAVAHHLDVLMETYEEVIERKTARFLAGCCETGAMLGGADRAEAAAFRAYGHHLGMAFQIADDLLDFLGDPKKTGKLLGTDLRDGRVTLPLIHTLAEADAETRNHLRELLTPPDGVVSDTDIATITATIHRFGGFEASQKIAEDRVDRALQELQRFPVSSHRDALERLARFVVARDR